MGKLKPLNKKKKKPKTNHCVVTKDKYEAVYGEGAWPIDAPGAIIQAVEIPAKDQAWVAVFAHTNSATYKLNGTARTFITSPEYRDIDEIWMDDPDRPGHKKDLSDLINIGLVLDLK